MSDALKPPPDPTGASGKPGVKAAVDSGPAGILFRAVRSVPAMKYAVAVAGLAATVAIVAGFRLNYSVVAVGVLFTIGLMYIILSFARFASKPTKTSRRINATVAWIFTILMAAVAVLFTTAIVFGWPQTLRIVLTKTLLPQNQYWKIKVFEFANYGARAEHNRIGQRFASRILDELTKTQIIAMRGNENERIAVVPARGPAHEAANVYDRAALAPAIVVAGSIEDSDISQEYIFSVRISVVLASTLQPTLYETGRLSDGSSSFQDAALALANKVTAVAEQQGVRQR